MSAGRVNKFYMLHIFFTTFCTFFVLLPICPKAEAQETPLVLVVNSYHSGFEWTDSIVKGIREEFGNSDSSSEMVVEYLDSKNHNPSGIFPRLEELFRLKYQDKDIGVIICSDNNALDFVLSSRDEIFSGVPVVFCGINNFDESMIAGQNEVTGVVEDADMRATIELAIRLRPETENIAVISDMTETDEANRAGLEQVKPLFENKVRFIYLKGLPAEDLRAELSKLPGNTAVLLLNSIKHRLS